MTEVFCLFLKILQQQNSDHGRPDLYEYGIGSSTNEGLDRLGLLDVLEEDLDVPAGLVKVSNGLCCPR